ncbi:acetyl-CoA C-acyltransferase [Nitratireductor indicus]|uniref:Acetyl-CoA acetyltransferase n=1 Tax=Nitratireductor indicus C115 TaxID=1231190 RepID=K2PA95_9HYPH|nr:acetyl-CoA C-acyltransferase [Nitratireductor indicus]EKF44066.1 acetyl-CoA acetyltransferase [Nitratireductor indicus C115]MDS1135655.1 acetyl-CoA C-acyltransferase [Nitratireductor indicus]SFQ10945.1 acetyl-CoA C-acetyltransferase [Nitratireductor indicus]
MKEETAAVEAGQAAEKRVPRKRANPSQDAGQAERYAARQGRTVYLVDGARTPFLRLYGKPGPFTPSDLAVQCGRPLLLRQGFSPEDFDEVVMGCANTMPDDSNPARNVALRLGMGETMSAFTVKANGGSGMRAIDLAFRAIEAGRADLVLAGGADAPSHCLLREPAPSSAEIAEAHAMGHRVEDAAYFFGISREAADAFALESHRRCAKAAKSNALEGELVPAVDRSGNLYEADETVQYDGSVEALAALPPDFENPYGRVTRGNAAPLADGACWLILASAQAVKAHKLSPLARIVDSEWLALQPANATIAPTVCVNALLRKRDLSGSDVDLWEMNEMFSAQILACLAAWEDKDFCRETLGLKTAFGRIDRKKLNVDGGAIGLGHPFAASSSRVVLHLANAIRQRGVKRGLAAEAISDGQAGAILLEAV